MKPAYKSIVAIVILSFSVSLLSIPSVDAQGQPYAFTETWNYDGVHPEVNAGDSWEAIDTRGGGWPYWEGFGTPLQDLYGDHHWTWSAHAGLYNYGSAWIIGNPPPGDHATASYTFCQSSGAISVNATAHAYIVAQGGYTGWPHWNVAGCSHTLELVGGCGLFGNRVKVSLENASAQGSSTAGHGEYNVYLVLECTFYVKTLISKNPDNYSVEYKRDSIALVRSSYGWFNYPRWYLNCPSIASGEYGLVDVWNQIYGYNYSTLLPTEIGQKYVSNVHVGKVYVLTAVGAELYSSVTEQDSTSSAELNIGKITIEELHAPVVSTSPATDVTKQSATLNSLVTDDGGEACQYRFRYKDDKSDYLCTAWTGSMRTGEPFSEPISGLKPNGTYYFNAQAKNSVGESPWGNEQAFVAKPIEAPVLEILRAQMVSPHELEIGTAVTFPKNTPGESAKRVDLWANINGKDIFQTCDIPSLRSNGTAEPGFVIDLREKDVPRFEDNVNFTLYGTAYWEGGPHSDVASTPRPVQILLPVIIVHGYTLTHKAVGSVLHWAKIAAYDQLMGYLISNGYSPIQDDVYRTMWGPAECQYEADKVTESEICRAVDSWIVRAMDATYAAKVNLVAHCLGGLVARYYCSERYKSGLPANVNKVIMIGTPHLGETYFYMWAFEYSTKEEADRILRTETGENNLLLWGEPQYGLESCLIDVTTGTPAWVPEPYESTFNPHDNPNVKYYSIYGNNHKNTPYRLYVVKNGLDWYSVVSNAVTMPGDDSVLEFSASAFAADPPPIGSGNHGSLCEEDDVMARVREILTER